MQKHSLEGRAVGPMCLYQGTDLLTHQVSVKFRGSGASLKPTCGSLGSIDITFGTLGLSNLPKVSPQADGSQDSWAQSDAVVPVPPFPRKVLYLGLMLSVSSQSQSLAFEPVG